MILSVSEQAPAVVADERHPTYRKNPPPRPEPRKRAQVGTKLVEYVGAEPPTQGEVDTFLEQAAAAAKTVLAEANGRALAKRQAEALARTDPGEALLIYLRGQP